ncbi:uncharacterized protein LOC144654602 [Oculina patagonica]
MYLLTVQILVILATFERQCSVIAKSLSQRSSSKDETSCEINGESHPVNSSFITNDCSLQCYCMMGGVASCMDFCPQMSTECPPGTMLKEEEAPVGSGGVRCSCKRRFCVSTAKVTCYRDGKEYKVDETFISKNCSESCRCNENGQISCVPMCSKMKCPKGMRPKGQGAIKVGEKSWCWCPIQECVPVPKTFCHVDGRRFRRGRVFVTKNCTLKCRCRKNGVPRCAPLCKTKRNVPVCGPDERLTEILDLFAGGRCSCETKTCIRKSRHNMTEKKVSHIERKNT